jgi:4-hydroxy-tetrahydrodipicolinate synthase
MGSIHVPLITPFDEGGAVAHDALVRLAHEVLDAGADGLVALGTTGEPATLDDGERQAVRETVGRACRERGARFTVGVASNDPRRAAEELAGLTEADAALVTVPYFTRPPQDGVVAYFERLAAASPVPLIVYNIPYRTGLGLTADTVRRLAAIPGVAGFKHAVGGIDQDTVALVREVPLLAGDDIFAPALLALGAAGGILASAHLATDRWVRLARPCGIGGYETGSHRGYDTGLGHELAAMAEALFAEPSPAVIKAVLHPLLPASGPALETALRAIPASGDTRDRMYALIGETG